MASQAEEALTLGKQLIEGLKRRDPHTIISILDKDIVLEVPYPLVEGENTTGARRQESEAVHAYLRDMKERTSEIRFRNEIWRTTNDGLALFEADGDITLSDGRPYPNHYLFMFEAAGGKIVRWREYLNPVAAIRAFGAPVESLPS